MQEARQQSAIAVDAFGCTPEPTGPCVNESIIGECDTLASFYLLPGEQSSPAKPSLNSLRAPRKSLSTGL